MSIDIETETEGCLDVDGCLGFGGRAIVTVFERVCKVFVTDSM